MLETHISDHFKNYHMTIEDKLIIVIQKNQMDKLFIVDIKDHTKK